MPERRYSAEVVIAGGGIAGIVTALELLDRGRRVLLLDRDTEERFGGLAKESFGGIFMVGTPEQHRLGIRDDPELALADWRSVARFDPEDRWPRRWAEAYVERSLEDIHGWLRQRGVGFFPMVHWVERGLFRPGNSVPRFHMVWGTGHGLIEALAGRLLEHRSRDRLRLLFGHRVERFESEGGRIAACSGVTEEDGEPFEARGDAFVVAAGGICGSLEKLHANWYRPWGTPPPVILNGAHRYGDGKLHDAVAELGGGLTHLDLQWHYAAGVHHPRPDRERHGISLVPPKSALWMDAEGRRFGPMPLITAYDTRHLVETICRSPHQYSWQVLNWKIAVKELAVSGSEFNDSIRDKKVLAFLKDVLLGNPRLVRDLVDHCEDFVVADTVEELAARMNALTGEDLVDPETLEREIRAYDDTILRGPKLHNDEQLRRITHCRQWRGDRARTCAFQPILDPKARPLIAIREFILARKSLGGIVTDLESRVLDRQERPIPGLYAVGEAAGFGGGGSHGRGALEGTFLGSCILTAQSAARSMTDG
ncbi:MAG TPA: FAD-binding dehydrogenase [Acidobacteria bacterium]|nr:FAD-binding dehydrogenase [Acidobacteriota bacterium]